MKILNLFFVILLAIPTFSQVLKSTNLNLNNNGKIFDVEHIPGLGAYVVVGDFDSIGGFKRNNLALIDDQTFEVKTNLSTFNNNLNFDGVIRSVEYKQVGSTHYLVLGGNFFSINGSSKQGMALLTANGILSPSSNFTLYNWDYATTNNNRGSDSALFANGVYDLLFVGDTLYVGGHIYGINLLNSNNNVISEAEDYSFFALKATPFVAAKFSIISASYTNAGIRSYLSSELTKIKAVLSIRKIGNKLFITGGTRSHPLDHFFQKRNLDLTIDHSFVVNNTQIHYRCSIENLNDSIFTAIENTGGLGGNYLGLYNANRIVNHEYSKYDISQPNGLGNLIIGNHSYNSDLLVFKLFQSVEAGGERNVLKRYKLDGNPTSGTLNFSPIGSENLILPNVASMFDFSSDVYNNIIIKRNKLFLISKEIKSVDSAQRKGLAIFCLEPEDPKPFINPDLSVCSGNQIIYTIPPSKMVDGYRWNYSGSGAKYRVAGTTNVFQSLIGDQFITDINRGNAIEIQFEQGVTAGTLTVTPFSTCNSSTDYVFARSQSINLQLSTPPVMSMPDSLNFTCLIDTVQIIINTPVTSPQYSWSFQNNSTISNTSNSLIINKQDNVNSGFYYGFVTDPATSCKSIDSTYISYDTIAQAIPLNSFDQSPTTFNCLSGQVELRLNIPNATIHWAVHPDSLLLANPLVLYTFDTTTVYGIATYASNGCTAKQEYQVLLDTQQVSATINGFPLNGIPLIFDTLNCINPQLSLECGILSGVNGNAAWLINGVPSGSLLNLSIADTVGMNQQFHTKTYSFRGINTDNGCYTDINVTVLFDFEKPFVSQLSDQYINCSQNFIDITHPVSGGSNTNEGWLDSGGIPTGNNSLIAYNTGVYYYQVENTLSGCTNYDTIQVIQSNELLLNLVSDTLICQGQAIEISVSNINNLEPTTYNWSNGVIGGTVNATGGIDNQLSVIAQNQSGCIGYDTIIVNVPSPVSASFIVNSTCTENAIQVSNITGGTANYQYALNNGSWQTTSVFNNLDFGTYTISVKDDLGCIYNFQQTIDGTAISPDINFLVSTYNLEGDTLAIVNISNFTGFDTLIWELPPNAIIHSSNDSVLIVSITSGGWLNVTLTGYIDTCSYSFTKPVYFGTEKPDFDVDHNEKGIKNLSIYPNPTDGWFTIAFDLGVNQNYSILVTDILGQLINGLQLSSSGNQAIHQMNFPAGLPTGNYRIHIVSDFDAKQAAILLID